MQQNLGVDYSYTMGCGCKKKQEAVITEPIKQPDGTLTVNETQQVPTAEQNQQQLVESILDKLKQINS